MLVECVRDLGCLLDGELGEPTGEVGVDYGPGVIGLQVWRQLSMFLEHFPVLGCPCEGGRG